VILVIGEILVDIFPQYRRIGGAPFNFSYHLKNLGLPVCFVSRIGADDAGKEISDFLAQNNFDTSYIQKDHEHPTGRVNVEIKPGGAHSFEIVKNTAYDHIELPPAPQDIAGQNPDLIYFGTLIQRTPKMFDMLQKFLKNRDPATRCFCDVNLRPECYTEKSVLASVARSDILKINDEELKILQKMLKQNQQPEKEFVAWLMEEFDIKVVSLTMGDRGSRLYTPSGCIETKAPESSQTVDTVGAGDAYAAVVALGCLQNWPPEKILSRATQFAGRICRIKGAIPDNHSFYAPLEESITGDLNA
jgi:fructokinase